MTKDLLSIRDLTKDEIKQGRAPKKRTAKKPAKEKAVTAG